MKPIFSTLLTAAALFAVTSLTSCSDDDAPDYGADVAGSYDCWASMNCNYFSNNISLDQKISVTKLTENTVSVSYTSATLGTFTIPEATVAQTSTSYVVTGAGVTEMGHAGSVNSYNCTLTANFTADAVTFTFDIPSVMGGTKVILTQGELPKDQYCHVVAGSYTGIVTATAQYFPDGMVDDAESTVTVKADAAGTVTVTCASETWGNITVAGMEVTRNGNTFSFAGQGTNAMAGMNGGAVKEYVCNATCSVDVANGKNDFSFVMPAVMGGLTLTLGE